MDNPGKSIRILWAGSGRRTCVLAPSCVFAFMSTLALVCDDEVHPQTMILSLDFTITIPDS